jgi:NADH-quinone oxidoreductase subunit J
MEELTFVGMGSVCIAMALCVVLAKSPLRSALALIVVQCALAGIYILLQAPFVAAMQVLVYAGAIMVLFLFVIMLLNLGEDAMPQVSYWGIGKIMGSAAMIAICATVVQNTVGRTLPTASLDGSVVHVGALLLGPYLFAFETVSVLLLTAVLGSIVLSLKRLT